MPAVIVVKPAERKITITEGTASNELFVPLEVQEIYAALKVLEVEGFSLASISVGNIIDWAIRLAQARRGT